MDKVITIQQFLSKEECGTILLKCKSELKLNTAVVVDSKIIESKRKSNVAFIEDLGFLNSKLKDTLIDKISVKGFTASKLNPFQFTEYTTGGFYEWHTDSAKNIHQNRFYSVVIQINEGYLGGELEVREGDIETILNTGIGNLYLFPSAMWHRVKPITNGIRYSLVNWVELEKIIDYKKTLI